MADLSTAIETAASTPAAASVDGQSATARSVPDLIAADQYLAAKSAARKRRRGLSFTKLVPPGAAADGGGPGGFDTPGGGS